MPRARVLARSLLLLVLIIQPVRFASAADPADEMKAAVVLGFLRYSEWPRALGGSTPIVVGMVGRGSFTPVLKRTLDGKSVNGRAIKVIELATGQDAPCHVIYFFGGDTDARQPARLGQMSQSSLTIGDAPDFLEAGGVIRLLLVDGRMSFEVSLAALERSGVTISSKLLRFGLIRGKTKGGKS